MTEQRKLIMQTAPHASSGRTTAGIMLDVIIALVPCLVAGMCFFGVRALLTVSLSVLAAAGGEALYNLVRRRRQTLGDLSAVVTGLILGLNLPSHVPVYIPLIGGAFATLVVKMLFGGIGKNFANPAATARVFLLLAYTGAMTAFTVPHDGFEGFFSTFGSDALSGATYLSGGNQTLGELFFGNAAGSLGETSALCILLGGGYLVLRGVIDWKIPASVLLSSACFLTLFGGGVNGLLSQMCAGGLLFGAVFMATDYATSPKTGTGRLIYGFGIGLVTSLIRAYGAYPEGMSLAILFMNLLVPVIDRYVLPVRFGEKRAPVLRVATWAVAGLMAAVLAVYAPVTVQIDCKFQKTYEYGGVESARRKLDSTYIVESYGKLDGTVYPDAGWADPQSPHYSATVWLRVWLDNGKIGKIEYVADTLHGDKATENEGVTADNFAAYLGKSASEIAAFDIESDVVSGATYTSKGIHDAVRAAASGYLELTGGAR